MTRAFRKRVRKRGERNVLRSFERGKKGGEGSSPRSYGKQKSREKGGERVLNSELLREGKKKKGGERHIVPR